MDAAAIITVFRFARLALERNLEGVTDSEALVAPAPNRVHSLLGLEPAWPARERSQAQVLERLGAIGPDRLAERATETMTVAEQLGFLGFHESYHVGQADLSRRLLGKAGAIA